MNEGAIGGGAYRRNTGTLRLAGVPFHGSLELQLQISRQIDQAALALNRLQPGRFKEPMAAKRLLKKRMAAEYSSGITGQQAMNWLATQDWRALK